MVVDFRGLQFSYINSVGHFGDFPVILLWLVAGVVRFVLVLALFVGSFLPI